MHPPNRKGWFAILFIVFTLTIPFALSYHLSTPASKDRFQKWRRNAEKARLPVHSKVTSEQVLLIKDEKVVIDRTCLIFKGVTNKGVNIDLYLLDLDSEIPYSLSFSKKTFHTGVWLGNIMYRLLSVKKNELKLKIESAYTTL